MTAHASTWKQPGPGGKHGTAGAESSGLDLSEGSELLVEEQGAVSKLITSDFASLAEMEVRWVGGEGRVRGWGCARFDASCLVVFVVVVRALKQR